jgi:hypothetical protein
MLKQISSIIAVCLAACTPPPAAPRVAHNAPLVLQVLSVDVKESTIGVRFEKQAVVPEAFEFCEEREVRSQGFWLNGEGNHGEFSGTDHSEFSKTCIGNWVKLTNGTSPPTKFTLSKPWKTQGDCGNLDFLVPYRNADLVVCFALSHVEFCKGQLQKQTSSVRCE